MTVRVDRLSLVFGYIFLIAAFLGRHLRAARRDDGAAVAALIYAGTAIGAVFAGDLITLFVFWEGTAITSVFLIWARRSERSFGAGMRYLIIQVGSGVLLLAGVDACHYRQTGSIAFVGIGPELAGQPADLPRLRHQVRLPAAAQLAAGRLSGGDRHRHGVALAPSPPSSRSTRWRAASPAPRS